MSFLLLCAMIALAAGWVHWRSYRVSGVGHWYGEKSWIGVYCSRGRIVVGVGREAVQSLIKHDYYERPVKTRSAEVEFDESFHGGRWLGVGYYQSDLPQAGYVLAPIWMIWTLAALPVLFSSLRVARKKWRKRVNLCINCGYDLRGSKEKCPECGRNRTAARAQPAAASISSPGNSPSSSCNSPDRE